MDATTAKRYAPIIRFDEREPFLPQRAAVTVFRDPGRSPSFPRDVTPPDDGLTIEYAIWWDWDIGHLYELEHLWVHVDVTGRVTAADASWHGGMHSVDPLTLEGDRVVVLSQPGKHAFAAGESAFDTIRARTGRLSDCGFLVGNAGVLVKDIFEASVPRPTPLHDTLVRTYLARHAFEPSWRFARRFDVASVPFVDWPALAAWIPGRMRWWIDRLQDELPRDEYRFLRVGHRGASARAPDNSLQSIQVAADLDAHAVELDVRTDDTGRAVLGHDAATRRAPTLDDALDLCRSLGLRVVLDIKDPDAVPAVVEALRARRMGGWAVIACFAAEWLVRYRAAAPRARTCLLVHAVDADAVGLALDCGASYVLPCWERLPDPTTVFTREWVDTARAAGLGVMTWHEERPEIIRKLRALGVDAICSDDPSLLLPEQP